MNRGTLIRCVVALLLVAGVVAVVSAGSVTEQLQRFLAWVESLGTWGLVAVAAAYTPQCLLFLPGSPISLGAGFLFGVVRGVIAVSIGSTIGASAAFLAGRTLLRSWIEGRIAGSDRFRALDAAVGEHGFKIVLLTRLSPIFPFNVLNYAFGLTKVRFRDYVLASWIGMFPGTVLYVYLGSAAKNLAELFAGKVEGGIGQNVLFFIGLVATLAVTVVVTRIAKQAVGSAIAEPSPQRETVGSGQKAVGGQPPIPI
jgi:uncharacterized membrane protein YdjX (TVP38/TMEM64 family)